MESIEISVIVPIYNGEKCIESTIKSIADFNQNINMEILLINDCSFDNTKSICKKICNKNSFVKYYENKTNLGVAKTRNIGISKSKGKYITFVDQDDSILKSYKSFIDIIKKENIDLIITDCYTNKNERIFKQNNNKKNIKCGSIENKDLAKYLLCKNGFNRTTNLSIACSVWNCIFSTKFIKKNKIEFIKLLDYEDDWLFIIECLKNSKNIYISNDAYYCWKYNQNSESHRIKYIEKVYEKSIGVKEYVLKVAKELEASDIELERIKDINDLRIVINTFNYEIWNKNYHQYKKNVSLAIDIIKKNRYKSIKQYASLIEKINIILLLNNLYKIPRYFNRMLVYVKNAVHSF